MNHPDQDQSIIKLLSNRYAIIYAFSIIYLIYEEQNDKNFIDELQYWHRWTRLRLCVCVNRSADIGQVSLEVQLGTELIDGSDW